MLVQTLRNTQKEGKNHFPLQGYSVLFQSKHECCYIDTQLTQMHGLGPVQCCHNCNGQTRGRLVFFFQLFPNSRFLQLRVLSWAHPSNRYAVSKFFREYLISGSLGFRMGRLFPAEQFPLSHIMFMGTKKQTRAMLVYNVV